MVKINKKGAMELSMSTIVIIVISVVLLILGFVLVRNIMCSAIDLTGIISGNIRDTVNKMFETNAGEVQCIGDSGSRFVKMVPGETNIIYCGFRALKEEKYKFEIKIDEDSSTVDYQEAKEWLQDANFNRKVSPGDNEPKPIAYLRIPKEASEGDLIFNVEVYKEDKLISTKTLNFMVSRQGVVTAIMC